MYYNLSLLHGRSSVEERVMCDSDDLYNLLWQFFLLLLIFSLF